MNKEKDLIVHNKEVYIAYGLDNEVLYVGQGNIGRNSHCYSGISHNKHLNRYYFLNGDGDCIKTEIYKYVMCETEARNIEKELIENLSPLYNIEKQIKPESSMFNSFSSVSRMYYDTVMNKDNIEDAESKLTELKDSNKDFKEIIEVIGIEGIKNTFFNKTKATDKVNKIKSVEAVSKSKQTIMEYTGISKGDFLTYPQIKSILQDAFDKVGLNSKAKATDIKSIFNVKRTTRHGAEGYLIGEKH